MRVARYNYAAQFEGELDRLLAQIRVILERGDYDRSDEARAFERAFAAFIGSKHARGVGCGTDALILSLRALAIGPGDEVIIQANTFYASAAAIAIVGATPVLVDAESSSFLIDQEQMRASVTARTRAIIPVHLYGKPTPMLELMTFAEKRGIAVLEDAAQAHGAMIHGRLVGSFGTAGCFSFHPSKNLAAAADAGAVVTNSDEIARLIDAHRTHGQLVQHEHIVMGINTKLDAIQALVLSSKLPRLLEWNDQRRRIAAFYREDLKDLPLTFQREDPNELHAYHLFQVRTQMRDQLLEHLQRVGIDAVVRYPHPIHLQPPFACYGWRRGQFPVAEALANELLCLPIRPDMRRDEELFVVDCIGQFFGAAVA